MTQPHAAAAQRGRATRGRRRRHTRCAFATRWEAAPAAVASALALVAVGIAAGAAAAAAARAEVRADGGAALEGHSDDGDAQLSVESAPRPPRRRNPRVVLAFSESGGSGSVKSELIGALHIARATNATLTVFPSLQPDAPPLGAFSMPSYARIYDAAGIEAGLRPAATLAAPEPFAVDFQPTLVPSLTPRCRGGRWSTVAVAFAAYTVAVGGGGAGRTVRWSDMAVDEAGYTREEAYAEFWPRFFEAYDAVGDAHSDAAAASGLEEAAASAEDEDAPRCFALTVLDCRGPCALSMRLPQPAITRYIASLFAPSHMVAMHVRDAQHHLTGGVPAPAPWIAGAEQSVEELGTGARLPYACLHLNSVWCTHINEELLDLRMVYDAEDCLWRFVVPAVVAWNATRGEASWSTLVVMSQADAQVRDMFHRTAAALGVHGALPRIVTMDDAAAHLPPRGSTCCDWPYMARGAVALFTCADAAAVFDTPWALEETLGVTTSSFGRSLLMMQRGGRGLLRLYDSLAHSWRGYDEDTGLAWGYRSVRLPDGDGARAIDPWQVDRVTLHEGEV